MNYIQLHRKWRTTKTLHNKEPLFPVYILIIEKINCENNEISFGHFM